MKRLKRWTAFLLSVLLLLPVASVLPTAGAKTALPYCGVDVSRWQGTVDWAKAKKAGVQFAVLRCYAARKDTTFDTNYQNASAQGIALGAYVYMYATTEQGAVREAQATLDALAGKALTMPLFLDVEDPTVTALGKSRLTDLMLIELEIFAAAGYKTGVYTSQSFAQTYMDASRLTAYDWWIARWTCYRTEQNGKTFLFADESPTSAKKPDCDMWQFSNGGRGSTYGMGSTAVDLNFCYKDYFSEGPYTPNEHRYEAAVYTPTCLDPGYLLLRCADCGDQMVKPYAPALGHTAPDLTGHCARCGLDLVGIQNGTACPLCGQTHGGMFGWLTLFMHRLLVWMKRSLI